MLAGENIDESGICQTHLLHQIKCKCSARQQHHIVLLSMHGKIEWAVSKKEQDIALLKTSNE